MIPGPTPVPDSVLRKMAMPMINHRGKEFAQVLKNVTEKMKKVYLTESDVILLTASGSGGMESAVVNFLSPGDKAIFCVTGAFGDRWAKMGQVYGADVIRIDIPLGEGVTIDVLEDTLKKNPGVKAVYITHNETSTAITNDLSKVGEIAHRYGAIVAVDAVSSLGAIELRMDEWQLDVVVTASQKALMTPPGLAFVAVSERAWELYKSSKMPRFYFDLGEAKRMAVNGETPFTPAVSQVFAIDSALDILLSEGLENSWKRHKLLGKAVREGVKALGLKLLAKEEFASNAVTGVYPPEGILADELRRKVKERGVTLAGGQGALKGKIFRIGHIGYILDTDIIVTLSIIGETLKEMGYNVDPTLGVKRALEVFNEGTNS
ncbi:alanine--glyoxylate aminotransferase family protein [bacterium]|nr:alanine--glyoxylate aminotransferase family protein [bacterium]